MHKESATPSYRYYVRLNEKENADFISLYERSGARTKSDFIRARLFSHTFKVITTDKSTVDFYNRLTEVNAQIRKIGLLYNQTVRAINSYHSAKVAHDNTAELQGLLETSISLAEEIRSKWLQK